MSFQAMKERVLRGKVLMALVEVWLIEPSTLCHKPEHLTSKSQLSDPATRELPILSSSSPMFAPGIRQLRHERADLFPGLPASCVLIVCTHVARTWTGESRFAPKFDDVSQVVYSRRRLWKGLSVSPQHAA